MSYRQWTGRHGKLLGNQVGNTLHPGVNLGEAGFRVRLFSMEVVMGTVPDIG